MLRSVVLMKYLSFVYLQFVNLNVLRTFKNSATQDVVMPVPVAARSKA